MLNDQQSLLGLSGGSGVDHLTSVLADATNGTFFFQMSDSGTSQRTVDAETINQDSGGDELVGWGFLDELIEDSLVENDGVVGLILDLSLGPLLLLSSSYFCLTNT
jgi:hypothetical protein